jgi:hypothetical protein
MPLYNTPQAGGTLTAVLPGDNFTLFSLADFASNASGSGQLSVAFNRAPGYGMETPSSMVFSAAFATVQGSAAAIDILAWNNPNASDQQVIGTISVAASSSTGYYADVGLFAFYCARYTTGSGSLQVTVKR